jgi:TRAP-type C4-dicarboxylate transport system substrate-binding protein
MMQGSVQIYGDVLDWYANWVKDYAILAWGFTFRDADHMQKFLDSPTYAAMAEKLRKEQGLRILAAAPTQPRILFAKKPVGSLSDLNGVKMRVPEIKTYLTLWETLGTRPSRLAWGEIYLGLKTGVVEAAEGPISSAYSAKFHEAATNVIRTDHLMSSAHITVNDKAYSALPPDSQKVLADCATDAVRNTRLSAQQETEDVVRKMAAEGAKVTNIDKGPIQQRAKDGVARMEKDGAWTTGLWDQIQKL